MRAQVDSCSALVEDAQGRMDILHWMDHYAEPTEAGSAAESGSEASETESVVSLQVMQHRRSSSASWQILGVSAWSACQ